MEWHTYHIDEVRAIQAPNLKQLITAINDTRLIEQEVAVYAYMVVNEQVHTLETLMIRFSIRLPAPEPGTLFSKLAWTPGDMRKTLRRTLEMSLERLQECGYVVGSEESGWRCL